MTLAVTLAYFLQMPAPFALQLLSSMLTPPDLLGHAATFLARSRQAEEQSALLAVLPKAVHLAICIIAAIVLSVNAALKCAAVRRARRQATE